MKKPINNSVTFYRNEGKYNWINQNEVSAQYVFTLPHLTYEQVKEMGLQLSYLIDLEKDYSYEPDSYTALECAYEIKKIIDDYWINSNKPHIQKLVDYLESIEEEQEVLRHQYQIEFAKYQIHYWQKELEQLQS